MQTRRAFIKSVTVIAAGIAMLANGMSVFADDKAPIKVGIRQSGNRFHGKVDADSHGTTTTGKMEVT